MPLAVFAFVNPNGPGWYGYDTDNRVDLMAPSEAKLLAMAENLVDVADVHSKFMAWFIWGLISVVCAMLIEIWKWYGVKTEAMRTIKNGENCMNCLCLNLVVWFAMGLAFRFVDSGKYASGDIVPVGKSEEEWLEEIKVDGSPFQVESGKFIFIFSMIILGIVLVSLTIFTVLCLYALHGRK